MLRLALLDGLFSAPAAPAKKYLRRRCNEPVRSWYSLHSNPYSDLLSVEALSDETLMTAVRADDLDQLVPLFERYHGPLFNYLTRLTNDRETGQDLTQTVFERILKYRSSYQPSQPFRAWVFQMARNVHADHWQRQQKQRTDDVEEVERTGGLRTAAFGQMRVSSHHDDLHEALALLPAPQREILVLHRFQGFAYDEIGQLLNCTAEAARVKAHRALQALRKIYFDN